MFSVVYFVFYPIFVANNSIMDKSIFFKQLLKQEEELSKALDAVRELKKYYYVDTKSQGVLEFEEPEHNKVATIDGYDKDWIIKDKVYYILKALNKATASEVADKLVDLDEEFSKKKASRVSTHYLSVLKRNNIIGATKIGKKNRYYIKEEVNENKKDTHL